MWRYLGVLLLVFLPACLDESGPDDGTSESSLRTDGLLAICHMTANGMNSILIDEAAWPRHQDHGDMLGPCTDEDVPSGNPLPDPDEPCPDPGHPADDDGMDDGDDPADEEEADEEEEAEDDPSYSDDNHDDNIDYGDDEGESDDDPKDE